MAFFFGNSGRKLKIKKRGDNTPLLPESWQRVIAARLTDGYGLTLAVLGSGLFVALASYSSSDPSFNSSGTGDAAVRNMAGIPGAYTADLFLQTLGIASYLLPAALMVWGYRIVTRKPVATIQNRLPLLIASILLFAVAAARIPAFAGWGLGPYMGGSVGGILFNALSGLLQGWVGTLTFSMVAILCGVLSATAFISCLGFSAGEWFEGFKKTRRLSGNGWQTTLSALQSFQNWHARYSANDDKSAAPQQRLRASPKLDADVAAEETPLDAEPATPRKPIVAQRAEKTKPAKTDDKQKKLNLRTSDEEWQLPALDYLRDPPPSATAVRLDEASLQKNAELLQSTLNDFGVQGDILKVSPGPIVTLYEMEPAPGTKTSRVIGLSDDIARSMSAISVRVAVVAGKNAIGIEMPNAKRETVYLRELLATKDYDKTAARLPLVLGKNIAGDPVIADLARMPHLLVAGTTGSGKSVAINTMILSLLYRLSPEQCRFIMIDPKMLELSVYDDIPHLLTPVVTEAHRAVTALKWAVREMEDRYRAMSKLGVRNIDGFNERIKDARAKGEVLTHKIQTGFDHDTGKPVFEEQPIPLNDLPFIVIVVDEFADLMLVAGKEVENAIQRLAQMARAAGIHLIMATQRPSVDVITGVIKANFPTRVSFQVTSKIDSRTILGEGGAEQLLGQGDMLYMAAGGRITRVHGPFVSDDEVEKIVTFLKSQGTPTYIDGVTESEEEAEAFGGGDAGEGSGDALYDQAVAIVLRERKVSTSFIQRHLQIGYNRAARIVERMEKEGLISAANHVGKREILVDNYGT
jgi:S-DNA-T family DNA segregation ATPase FtsK/SpoIIIE